MRMRTLAVIATILAALLLTGCSVVSSITPAPQPLPPEKTLRVVSGSENKALEPIIADFEKANGVKVDMTYQGSVDIMNAVHDGASSFDAAWPANSIWLAMGDDKHIVKSQQSVMVSPVVFGIRMSKAKELGWVGKDVTVADILSAIRAKKLRFMMTSATQSNSGASAYLGFLYALLGHPDEITAADLAKPELQAQLKTILSGVNRSSGSSDWLKDLYLSAPDRYDAMVNYEAVILRANEKLAPADKLTLIYPRDGMISADYPLMLLNGDKREAYTKLVTTLKAALFQRDVLSAAFLRPANPEVAAASALPSAAVAELGFPNRLEVIDAVLGAYQSQWRKPATSIFVLDLSGSMRGQRLSSMRDALKLLSGADASSAAATASARYSAFQSRERVVLITFASDVSAPVWVRFEADKIDAARTELRRQADAMVADGGTAIYSALAAAEDLARQELAREPDRFVSIVLLTDGESNAGLKVDEFRARYSSGLPARIFPILFGEGNVAEMQQIAQLSGGREFDGRKFQLGQVFKEIRGYQ